MNVYFIRHGQSEANLTGVYCGWNQVSLTEKGFSDAKHAGTLLKDIPFERIYCSDLLRARQTCETALPNSTYEIDPLLREINVGRLVGLTVEEAQALHGERHRCVREDSDYTPFDGENRQMQLERTQKFLKKLEENAIDGNIAVFCHYGTICCALWHVLGVPFDFEQTMLSNGSCSIFYWSGERWKLRKWNITSTS